MLITDETDPSQDLFLVWKKYDALPQRIQDILTARELPGIIKRLQDTFHLDRQSVIRVSLLIRKILFGEVTLPQAEAKLGSILMQSGSDPNHARSMTQYIDREIVHLVPKPVINESENITKAVVERLPLLQAMGKYPRLGEQTVTANRIRVKMQPEPVRGSLSNWIRYYRDELGIGFHDEILRGKFLFQSENGKRLSTIEREHLNLVLKSIE